MAPRPGIAIDESMWPLVIITFGGGITDDDWRGMFKAFEQLYQRREPFHFVNNGLSAKSGVSASQRRLIGEAARAHEQMSRRWCLGGATVLPNAIARGVLTAITWIAPPAYKLTVHATLPDAVDEALSTLLLRSIRIPPAAHKFRASLEPHLQRH